MKKTRFKTIKFLWLVIIGLIFSFWGLNPVKAQTYPSPYVTWETTSWTSSVYCTWSCYYHCVCDGPHGVDYYKDCANCEACGCAYRSTHGFCVDSCTGATAAGEYCANYAPPPPNYWRTTTYTSSAPYCHYISAVNSWSTCTGTQVATSVTWSTVAGSSCSHVALSRSCVPPGPVVDIKANGSNGPIAIDYDTAAVISWTSTNADSCSVTPSGWTEINNPGVSSGNLTATTTYTLTCVNSYGTSTPDSVTICVSNCSCASSTCVGDTCSDGCGGNCAGTMPNTCSSWGSCSKDCGGGIQTKSCFCPSRTETQSCNSQPCLNEGYREVTPW